MKHTVNALLAALVCVCSGCMPVVYIIAPVDGTVYSSAETVRFACVAFDVHGGVLDGANVVWESDHDGTIGTGAALEVTGLSVGTHTITVRATDTDTWHGYASVTVTVTGNRRPRAVILEPLSNERFSVHKDISFSGEGDDYEDGSLEGDALTWESTVDGVIGTGASFTRSGLSPGKHVIALTAYDSEGAQYTDNVSITVYEDQPDHVGTTFSTTTSTYPETTATSYPETTATSTIPQHEMSTTTIFVKSTTTVNPDQETTTTIPSWEAMALPCELSLFGLWGSAEGDVFAAGGDGKTNSGVILHYDGSRWTETFRAEQEGFFYSVRGRSSQNIFAAGGYAEGLQQQGVVYRFDGSGWMESFVSTDMGILSDIWVLPSGGAVAAGGAAAVGGKVTGKVLFFDGTLWGEAFSTARYGSFNDVCGVSDERIYGITAQYAAAASPPFKSRVLVSEDAGVNWRILFEKEGIYLRGVWSDGDTVCAVGGDVLEQNSGTVFTSADAGIEWSSETIAPEYCLNDVWGTSSSQLYAVGDDGIGGVILYCNGLQWDEMKSGMKPLYDVWGLSEFLVFAAGDEIILRYSR